MKNKQQLDNTNKLVTRSKEELHDEVVSMFRNKYEENGNRIYQAMDFETIMNELNLTDTIDVSLLVDVLNSMVDEYELHVTNKNRYMLTEHMPEYKIGKMDIRSESFGFLLNDTPGENDIHIDRKNLNGALDGDKVLVQILPGDPSRPTGTVLKIIERDKRNVVGEIKVIKSKKVFVTKDKKFTNADIKIDQKELDKCVEGEMVAVSLTNGDNLVGNIKAHIGHKDDPSMDIVQLAAQYDVFEEFPEDAMKQAEALPTEVTENEKIGREDLTDKMIFTIDGKDTKDIDDAISLDINSRGNYVLGVHIADVSHYIPENSPLDVEALVRATSNYPADKVIPQLPHIISNGICSLNEGVERLAITCEMEINNKGRVIDSRIYPSVIKSNKKMNYTDCNRILNNDIEEGYEPFVEKLLQMNELHKIIRKERQGRGASDFDTTEVKFVFDENHHAIDVIPRERGEFEKVIEDFMIVANETVARQFADSYEYVNGLPSIYRVHAAPSPDKVQKFISYCTITGHPIVGKFKNVDNAKTFQKILDQIEASDDEKEIIMKMAIRTMAKAIYSKENIGHFGLASRCYTHFTSPIRRYPDLQIHRLLRTYFFEGLTDDKTVSRYDNLLGDIAKQSSDRERNADELERAVDDMYMADYMQDHIGEEYDAIVSGVQKYGLFVQLPNYVEGLIKVENLPSDIYEYDEEFDTLYGKNTKAIYRIGTRLHVRCIGASKEARQVDFEQIKPDEQEHQRAR